MKTIKQLREEHDNRILNQMSKASSKLVLEGRGSVVKTAKETRSVPLPNQMPAMLLFRRVAYRLYPDKQVVALYYSKTVDKYLSVPFGPDGNLNLSESIMYNTFGEVELAEGAKWEAIKGGIKGAAQGAMKGAAVGSVVTHLPGIAAGAAIGGAVGAYKGAKKGYQREKRVEENAMLKSFGSWALKKALDWTAGDGKEKDKDKEPSAVEKPSSEYIRRKPGRAGSSSWKQASSPDATYQSRLKAATQRDIENIKTSQVAENKISHVRKMVSEGNDSHDMIINGRTVTLNTSMAKRILEVYDSVNSKNKKIVENMLNEDLESFKKLINFSIKA